MVCVQGAFLGCGGVRGDGVLYIREGTDISTFFPL